MNINLKEKNFGRISRVKQKYQNNKDDNIKNVGIFYDQRVKQLSIPSKMMNKKTLKIFMKP